MQNAHLRFVASLTFVPLKGFQAGRSLTAPLSILRRDRIIAFGSHRAISCSHRPRDSDARPSKTHGISLPHARYLTPFPFAAGRQLRGTNTAHSKRLHQDANSTLYTSLNTEGSDNGPLIRLLELLPGHGTQPVASRLHSLPLSNLPSYEAISYCWGDPQDHGTINCNGHSLFIPRRLEIALRTMRHTTTSRLLWADAICINQASDSEKTIQVQLMRRIFAQAQRTLIWIGDAEERKRQRISRFALLSLKASLLHLRRRLKARKGPDIPIRDVEKETSRYVAPFSSEFYLELIGLLRMPWFRRAWVVQEVAVSSQATIFWGNKQYEWDDVVRALKFMADVDFPLAFIVTLEHISAIEEERRFYRGGQQRLHGVLARHQRCLATDDRDKIFSFVGLVEGSSAPTANVDIAYDATIEGVYLQTARAILAADRTLDLLSRAPSTTPSTLNLPSWVPDWSCAPANSLTYTWGHGPLSLTGVELSPSTPRFKASGSSVYAQSPPSNTNSKAIVLSGYAIDEIAEIGPVYEGIRIPTQVRSLPSIITEWGKCILSLLRARKVFIAWQKIAYSSPSRFPSAKAKLATYSPTGENLRQAFLSTVSTGEASNSSPGLDLELHLFERSARIGIVGLPYSAWILISHFLSNKPFLVCELQGRYSLQRRLVKTREGRLGLVSAGVKKGDNIMLARGASVPLVLRSMESKEEWQLVGDAYVYGIMNGEIWDEKRCGSVNVT